MKKEFLISVKLKRAAGEFVTTTGLPIVSFHAMVRHIPDDIQAVLTYEQIAALTASMWAVCQAAKRVCEG